MKKIYIFISVFLIIVPILLISQDSETFFNEPFKEPGELVIQLNHLNADVKFQPEMNKVIAKVEFNFRTLRSKTDSITFYCPDFVFSSITIDGKKSGYKMIGNDVTIFPIENLTYNTEHTISLIYEASPQQGAIYFIGWNDKTGKKRKQIWSHRPHGWLPYIDARLTVDMKVTFDKNYKVFSNGVRFEVLNNPDGTKTWHYKMNKNHPFFSTALVIGNYKYKSFETNNKLPLELWYYPEQENRFNETYRYSAEMVDFFDFELGSLYPYELYRQAPVADYLYGAMETTTSTVFGDYMFIDRRAFWQRPYINVNAHELAHQWFGNSVAHFAPKDVWLTESFATYYAKLFEKSVFGEDFYQNDRKNEMEKAFSDSKSNNNPLASSRAGTNRIYQKGSLVLDMLRYVLGENEFRASIKEYLKKFSFRYSSTEEFQKTIFEVTGKNIDWFFNEWIYRGGEPHFQVSYSSVDDEMGKRYTSLRVEQIHTTDELVGFFKMPVIIEIYYKDGSTDSLNYFINDKLSIIDIPNHQRKLIDFVIFDPGDLILKKITFHRSYEELTSQAGKSGNMIDRYNALKLIPSSSLDKKRDFLQEIYKKENFWLIKSEIINQLSADNHSYTYMLFKNAIKDPDALVRRAIVDYVKDIPVEIKKEYENLLKDTSYYNVEIALENLCRSFPKDKDKYLDITKHEQGWRGMNIRMKWLEIAIGKGESNYLNELKKYTANNQDFETRINAFQTLKKLNYLDLEILPDLIDGSLNWHYKINSSANDALSYFYKQNHYKKIIDDSLKELNDNDNKRIQNILK